METTLVGGDIERYLSGTVGVKQVLGEIVANGCVRTPCGSSESTFITTGPVEGRRDRFTLYGKHRGTAGVISTKHGLRYVPPAEEGAPEGYVAYPLNDESKRVDFTTSGEIGAIQQLRVAHTVMQELFEKSNPNCPSIEDREA